MLLYVTVGTNQLAAAGAFYGGVLATLGLALREADPTSIGMPDRAIAAVGSGS